MSGPGWAPPSPGNVPASPAKPARRRRGLWLAVALVVLIGAGGVALVLANSNDNGVATIGGSTNESTGATDQSSSSVAESTASTDAVTTSTGPATTALATTPPTAPPSLAVRSISSSPAKVTCGATPPTEVKLTWKTALASSVSIGIDNPGVFEQDLPPSGSLTVPFQGCTNGNGQVTYYVIAHASNGDQSTTTIVVKASP